MKQLSLIISALLLSFGSMSQVVMSIEKSEKKYAKDSLQELYFYRIMTDEIVDCFDVGQDVFLDEWSNFTKEVTKYLRNKGFNFGRQIKGLIEVYFNKEGKIDYFFISLRESDFPEDKFNKMTNLLSEFSKEYKFTIQSKIAFSNMGGITFFQ